MSIQEILDQVTAGKLSSADAAKLLGNAQKAAAGLTVIRNRSGGVYIRHPKFVAHSEKKGKDYVAGINLDASVAKVLFTDEAVYAEIAKQVAALLA